MKYKLLSNIAMCPVANYTESTSFDSFSGLQLNPQSLAAQTAAKKILVRFFCSFKILCSSDDFCIIHNKNGKPMLATDSSIFLKQNRIKPMQIYISLSHTKTTGFAMCIIEEHGNE